MKKSKRLPPRRPSHDWELTSFRLPGELNEKLEIMKAAMGGSKGEFLRYLLRQEWKGFILPRAVK
jgi:hypothetical protein